MCRDRRASLIVLQVHQLASECILDQDAEFAADEQPPEVVPHAMGFMIEVDVAIEFADSSPLPDPSELLTNVYTEMSS